MSRRPALLLALAAAAACGGGGGGGGGDGGGGAADAPVTPLIDGAGAPGPDADLGPPRAVHLIGRFDDGDPDAPRFAWPGSTIAARFDGTTIAITLDDGGGNWFSAWIDGEAQPAFVTTGGSHDYTVASDLAAGEHLLVVSRRTESFFGTTTFRGLTGATLVPSVRPFARTLELVGDSITCGYGVLGVGPTCDFTADTESEPDAWGGIAARALGAGQSAVAYSGKGVYRNRDEGDAATMPVLFGRVVADDPGSSWDFDAPPPDVVAIDLGTNDFAEGDPGQPFVDAYDAFVQQVRGRYPAAYILVANSPMISDGFPQGEAQRTALTAHLHAVVDAAHGRGDDRVDYLDLAEQDPDDGYGCAYHPNVPTQEKMAAVLVAQVRAKLGW